MESAWLAQILTQRERSKSCQSDRNGTNSLRRRRMQSASPRHSSQFHDALCRTRHSSPIGSCILQVDSLLERAFVNFKTT